MKELNRLKFLDPQDSQGPLRMKSAFTRSKKSTFLDGDKLVDLEDSEGFEHSSEDSRASNEKDPSTPGINKKVKPVIMKGPSTRYVPEDEEKRSPRFYKQQ